MCDSTELLNWSLGTIPGGGITVSVPIFVASGTTAGRLLALEALANDDGTNAAVVGSPCRGLDGPLTLAVDEDANPVSTATCWFTH